MNINYQIMDETQKNSEGKYIPDYQKLIEGASCSEEVEYIEELVRRNKEREERGLVELVGFAFNMVYITRQKCGHFEIFQTPYNEYHTLERNLELAKEHAEKMKCTRCICGRI